MNGTSRTFFTVFFFLFIGITVSAQSDRASLESQKREIQKKIQETEKILSQTSNQRSTSLGRLRALNNQIRSRSSLITAIQSEVNLLDVDISENQDIINSMEKDVELLKEEYGAMIYASHKSGKGFNELTFLFASNTFNQLFMRLKYLKQYSEARKKQASQIRIVQDNLALQNEEIASQKTSKQSLLSDELSENKKVENLQSEQRALVNRLTRQEAKIKKQLQDQRNAEKELTSRIDAIIEAERRAALLSSVDMSALSESFAGEKGKLPWPVNEGFISSKFGTHKHPTLKRVTIRNEGVDIQTSQNASVRAVFPGKVISIMSVQGLGNTVILQHGDYFTAYSKLKSVYVKTNDEVQSLQELGQVLTDSENISEVKFRIHDPKGSVNPEAWLQGK